MDRSFELPGGARYTNRRDVREFERIGFLDIEWKKYCFKRHLEAVKAAKPMVTVALDIHDPRSLPRILDQASELNLHSERVIIVPQASLPAEQTRYGYSQEILPGMQPSRYGGTSIPPSFFKRPVHLGGPDVQRRLAEIMPIVSLDCNRFTLDAAFGDYFDGDKFRPHPAGGYERCIRDSLKHINSISKKYHVHGAR